LLTFSPSLRVSRRSQRCLAPSEGVFCPFAERLLPPLTVSMTSQTQPAAPFSRFSRVGFGMGLKSRPGTRDSNGGAAGGEDEWYIPYTGPYEPPREPPRRQKARDSWGDPVGGEDNDAILVNAELHNQYGGYARGRGDDERKSHTRDRTHSAVSRGPPSSGEPTRTSIGMRRRSTVSGNQPTVPSYTDLGTSGGVGESPTPHLRTTKEANRLSLASIFSFGSGRKSPTSSPLVRDRSLHKTPSKKAPLLSRPNTSSGGQDLGGPSQSPALRRRSSTNDFNGKSPLFERQRSNPPRSSPEASTPDDEDYYNSYYSTLIQSPQQGASRRKQHSRNTSLTEPFQQRSRLNSPVSRQSSTSPTYSHPYAYAFPTSDIPTPTSPQEPGPNNFQQQRADPPRLTFTTPHIGNGNADTLHYASTLRLTGVGVRQLKNSASTPNLRSPSPKISHTRQNPPDDPPPPMFTLPKGKDRWLSAETWCDALLFPRPRLKVKQDENGYVGSGRIVSPPGTPLVDEFGMNQSQEQGIVSRVLAHSRSLVDLSIHASPSKSLTRERVASTSRALDNAPVALDLKPRRPTSFAQDDLALLSPASSLSKYTLIFVASTIALILK
jgi:serine/arginine repetitive matrix protein 2